MVGRVAEKRTLARTLNQTQAGRGGAVFLVGENGVGKTRLASAGIEMALAADMSLLRGRGSGIGPMVPFRSVTEALMSLLRADHSIDVAELGPYRPILGRLVPEWGLTTSEQPPGSLVVLAEAVLRLIGLAGRNRGCLMVLDDLQDADPETLAIVEYLVDNLAGQPAAFIGVVRAEPSPALELARSAARRGTCSLIELECLDKKGLRLLAGGVLRCDVEAVPDPVVDRLWADSGGNPLLAEEMLVGMLDSGALLLDADGWRVVDELRVSVPDTVTRNLARRLDQLSPPGQALLAAAAVLGRRFPLSVLQAVAGLDDRSVLRHLQGQLAVQLVKPDYGTPDWYAFVQPITVEVLLSRLTAAERTRLSRQAADAVEAVHPGLPGEWCQMAAALRTDAGEHARAAQLFMEAGRRALTAGAASSAVALLDRAWELLSPADDVSLRADAMETLLYALAEAGLVERAMSSLNALDKIAGGLDRRRRAQLHTKLAWAANIAGRTDEGLAQVQTARALLGPSATDEETAPLDVVAAHLLLDVPGRDQPRIAETMVRRAALVAEAVPIPIVACQAWQLLGALSRDRDLDEATACLERSRQIAVRHQMPIWEIHALVRLGNDDAIRDGDLNRLEEARRTAAEAGAVTAGYQIDSSIALQAVLRGDFAAAETLIGEVLAATSRLGLLETTHYLMLTRAILAGHQGRRRDMDRAIVEFRERGGDPVQHESRISGLARAFCALLQEDRPRAFDELTRAVAAENDNPTVFVLSGRHGLHLLLTALSKELDRPTLQEASATSVSRLRWNQQFVQLARAVLAGRMGRVEEAAEAVAEAQRVAAPYAMARHLGLRLVGEAALAEGWGTPVQWLHTAENYFHQTGMTEIASACRGLLRRAGASVPQRRDGAELIPPALRSMGITVREYEILQLLMNRLGNREIAARLHISARTVEKHVASLIVKTGHPNRIVLSEFAATTLKK
ncbi:MAG TPA: AAA family ATPase [Micromonosporaceae bacterium]|nr:AAA family ATPase [Micromonosporaceae bacterium]